MNNTFSSKYHQKSRGKLMAGGLFLVVIAAVTLFSVSQLDVVRDFLSRATGEPANLRIDTQAVIGPMPRPWRNLAQGGEAFDWQLAPLNNQVAALEPEYIRIDHIYDFYDIVQGTSGNITFNFTKFDVILDQITATGAKPFIALSYMPPAISSGDIVSTPVRWEDWQLVVQRTIEHVSGTKGISDVYYEVWNEPDLFGDFKYYGDKNYLTLYSYAAQGAANARGVQPFKIGGPGITALYRNWFNAMAKHAIDNNLRYDFFSWHRYANNIEQYQEDMLNVRTWIQDYPQLEPTLEFQITEWGHDSNVHPGYDTRYGAAHTVAGAIEMIGVVQRAFVFEIQDGKDPNGQAAWGRWGMFQHQDFGAAAKPRYNALRMLDRIGDQRLQILGKGSWVKAAAARDDDGNTELVIVNFDPRGSHAETVPVTFENIDPGEYTITKQYLSGQQTSENVATTAAVLQVTVPMQINDVAFVELSANQPTSAPPPTQPVIQ